MATIKYKVIKSKRQYKEYCIILEKIIDSQSKTKELKDEIELLTALIEIWDLKHNTFSDSDPIELLKSLMQEKGLKPKDLVEILNVSKGLISDILNYKKGLSKEIIRILSDYFNISQEGFNRKYNLKIPSISVSKKSKGGKKIKLLA